MESTWEAKNKDLHERKPTGFLQGIDCQVSPNHRMKHQTEKNKGRRVALHSTALRNKKARPAVHAGRALGQAREVIRQALA